MAGFVLHTSPASPTPKYEVRTMWQGFAQKPPSSTLFFSPALAIGIRLRGEEPRLLIRSDSTPVGFCERTLRTRNSNGDGEGFAFSSGGRCWKCEVRRMNFLTRGSGGARDSSRWSGETVNDGSLQGNKRTGKKFDIYFVDQQDEGIRGKDSFLDNSVSERAGSAERMSRNPVLDTYDLETRPNFNKDADQPQSTSILESTLHVEDIGLRDKDANNRKDAHLDDASSLPVTPARARKMRNRAADIGFYEENLHDEDALGDARIQFTEYERGPEIYKIENDRIKQAQRLVADNIEINGESLRLSGRHADGAMPFADNIEINGESLRLSGRHTDGAMPYERQVESRFSTIDGENFRAGIGDHGHMDGKFSIWGNESGRASSTLEQLADDKGNVGGRNELIENLAFNKDLRREPMDEIRSGELRQSSSQRRAETYPPLPDMDAQSFSAVWRGDANYELSSRRRPSVDGGEPEADAENWRSGAGNVNERSNLQTGKNRGSGDSETEDVNEIDWAVQGKESTGSNTSLVRKYIIETEQEVLLRGVVYAKQVISQETAQTLGFITQLWVDLESLKVVALEVRPNLLFGDSEGILLESVSKVGDVILIHSETVILEDLDLSNCSDLVGIDLMTESGFYLGKVRDYNFNLHGGDLVSLEFDSFGVPFIPSTVISTYILTVDEVIEAQDDSLLVRNGAEKRVRKLTKGVFSRLKKPYSGRQLHRSERRKRKPQPTTARSLYREALEPQHISTFTRKQIENIDGFVGQNYTPRLPNSRIQELRKGSMNSVDRRLTGESYDTNKCDSDSVQYITPDSKVSPEVQDFLPDQQDDLTLETKNLEVSPKEDNSNVLDCRESESTRSYISVPEVSLPARGLPMFYRVSKTKQKDGL